MSEELQKLIERTRAIQMTPDQERVQRHSFVYGNTHIENELITREMVEKADEKVEREGKHER